ncbi:DUF975 family protein [Terribacillus sp. DMT04]|uniref:DUF975 family protein n=1 Tax=Terribacillus sp. DMT04 TaxID=2850441 RepID=UPI001C2BAD7C|nr:DUF975 family protein [Terribacillus sp. DMT04]QXE01625.1 DUF975 family protein [Terribacillus sp. DMT04]
MLSKPDLKGMALTGLSFRWGKGVLAGFLLYLFFGFLVVFLSILSIPFLYITDTNNLNLVVLCIAFLLFYTLLMPLSVGTSWFYLLLIRNETASVSLMFSTFKYFPKLFTVGVMKIVLVFLWSLLLIIPGILKYYSYSQSIYILKDEPNLRAMEAISESKRRMEGHRWKLFCMQISFIGWFLLGAVTTISHLWTYPYYKSTRASFYEVYIKRDLSETDVISS